MNQKKINLSILEQFFEDHVFEEAEIFVEQKDYVHYEQINADEYYFEFEQEPNFICEVSLQGNFLKKCKCDCDTFKKEKYCAHLVASLLIIRNLKKAKKEKKSENKPIQKLEKKNDNLDINTIFFNTSQYDIQNFIKDIAKKDRTISLIFKATFIDKIDTEYIDEKYENLWQSVESQVIENRYKLTPNGQRLLLRILQIQANNFEKVYYEKNYSEAISILVYAVDNTLKILKTCAASPIPFEKSMSKYVTYFFMILESTLTFEKHEFLYQFAFERIHQKKYQFFNLNNTMVSICEKQVASYGSIALLVEKLLETKIDNLAFYSQNQVLATYLLVEQSVKKAINLLENNINNFDYLDQLFQKLLKNNRFDFFEKAIEKIKNISEKHLDLANKLTLEYAIYRNDVRDIDNQAQKLFLETYDLKYYDLMKASSSKKWKKTLENTIKLIQNQPFSIQKRDILGYIYFTEFDRSVLLEYVKNTLSVELLLQYTNALVFLYPKEILDIYQTWAFQFLAQHLGTQGAKRIREVMDKLFEQGHTELIVTIRSALYKKYPSRDSLRELLDDVLEPKKKRLYL